MGFPAISSALQPFQMCIYNRITEHFQMTLSWWATALWQICMHHWRVHANIEFTRLPPDIRTGRGSIIFHHVQAKSELNNFRGDPVSLALISFMGFHAISSALQPFQMCIYNRQYSKWTFPNDSQLMGNSFMANLHASLESTCKSKISKIATTCQNWGNHSSFNFWCWFQKCKFGIDIFHGFPAILSALQPFQMCILDNTVNEHFQMTLS